jgi:hypothetical protein
VNGFEDASAVELIWTALTLIGVLVSTAMAALAIGDLRVANAAGCDEATRIIAWEHVRMESLRATKQGLFLIIGVAAILTPETARLEVALFSTFAAGVLLFVEALIVLGTLLDYHDRRRLLNLVLSGGGVSRHAG